MPMERSSEIAMEIWNSYSNSDTIPLCLMNKFAIPEPVEHITMGLVSYEDINSCVY